MAARREWATISLETRVRSLKRTLLRAVAGLLVVSAALAIGILLIGRMGQTEGRILGTTAVLAAYGLVALPAAILFDQGRWTRWAALDAALVAAAAGATLAGMWSGSDSEVFGKTLGTLTVSALAATQVSALAARRQPRDPPLVRRLFEVSCALAGVLAAAFAVLIWAQPHGSLFLRVFGALAVLDLLCVALQPVLARLRATGALYDLVVADASGTTRRVTVEASGLANAAAKAIRTVEREGGDVVDVRIDTRGC